MAIEKSSNKILVDSEKQREMLEKLAKKEAQQKASSTLGGNIEAAKAAIAETSAHNARDRKPVDRTVILRDPASKDIKELRDSIDKEISTFAKTHFPGAGAQTATDLKGRVKKNP